MSTQMPDVSIRLAKPDDATAHSAFMHSIFSENLDTLIPDMALDAKSASRYIMQHDGTRSALFLAEVERRVVGAVNFSRFERVEKDHTVGVGLYVGKEVRHHGIGRRLMEAAIEWANSTSDVERIELLVMENNDRAIQLYQNLGFIREGLKYCAIKKPFGYLNVIVMGLLLKHAARALESQLQPKFAHGIGIAEMVQVSDKELSISEKNDPHERSGA